jgi:hypothetical protein
MKTFPLGGSPKTYLSIGQEPTLNYTAAEGCWLV